MRQIVLDTETTGLETSEGHRIIEIGCVELDARRPTGRTFHQYIRPDRQVDAGAVDVHGITDEFLSDKPAFEEIVEDFLAFVDGAQLVIHNAPFDVGFLDYELKRADRPERVESVCTVLDTLELARKMHPGQRNSLDALCKRYEIDNTRRTVHGALLDAEILAEVYLTMTGGQAALSLGGDAGEGDDRGEQRVPVRLDGIELPVIRATDEELAAHEKRLDAIAEAAGETPVWRR